MWLVQVAPSKLGGNNYHHYPHYGDSTCGNRVRVTFCKHRGSVRWPIEDLQGSGSIIATFAVR